VSGTAAVLVAATGNVNISSGLVNGAVIDGVAVSTGNDVLLPFQSSPAQNGIYTVVASGPASRDPNFSAYASLVGLLVTVQSGATFANTLWQSRAPQGGTLGTTAIPFAAPQIPSPKLNLALGFNALQSITAGTDNTAVGSNAGLGTTSGAFNVAVGSGAGASIGAGSFDVFIGRNAGQSATSTFCIGIGVNALQNSTGNDNVAIGTSAMQHATTAVQNVAIGSSTLGNNISSNNNVAIGFQSLLSYTNGNGGNIAIGDSVLQGTTTGFEITAVGHNVLPNNTTGQWHAALGVETLFSNTTGSNNTAIGLSALHDNTTGNSNTGLGAGAGIGTGPNGPNAQQTGSYNTYIGAETAAASPTQQSHMTLIGAQASAALSNAVILGRLGTDVVYSGETVLGPNSSAAGAGAAARTVATLPPASAALMGARSFVTDATSPTFLGTLTGGGTVVCPVFCNGTAWVGG